MKVGNEAKQNTYGTFRWWLELNASVDDDKEEIVKEVDQQIISEQEHQLHLFEE